jgi:hypothetical protein
MGIQDNGTNNAVNKKDVRALVGWHDDNDIHIIILHDSLSILLQIYMYFSKAVDFANNQLSSGFI